MFYCGEGNQYKENLEIYYYSSGISNFLNFGEVFYNSVCEYSNVLENWNECFFWIYFFDTWNNSNITDYFLFSKHFYFLYNRYVFHFE